MDIVLLLVLLSIANNYAQAISDTEKNYCLQLRDYFANSASEFTSCAINSSRPIKLCENCVNSYLNVLETYQNLSQKDTDGIPCLEKFINYDRLQIVQIIYSNVDDLWNRAKCYECFDSEVSGALSPNKSHETIQFNEYFDNLMTCVNRTDINNETLCPSCMSDYIKLNEYYLSISNENEKIGVCMDIVDVMNNTWHFWSEHCCKYRRHSETVFIASSVGILVVTVLFYAIARWCVVKKSPTIIQQSRFAESLNNVVG